MTKEEKMAGKPYQVIKLALFRATSDENYEIAMREINDTILNDSGSCWPKGDDLVTLQTAFLWHRSKLSVGFWERLDNALRYADAYRDAAEELGYEWPDE